LTRGDGLGRAYNIYLELSEISETHEICIRAAKAAEASAKKAQGQWAEVEKVVADKDYPQAIKLLAQMSKTYAQCEFGDRTKEKLDSLRGDPSVAAVIERAQLNDGAEAMEAIAEAAEKTKDYKRAIGLYERYVREFQKADRYKAVKAHLEAMKADKKIAAAIRGKIADGDCKKWLSLARNYLNVNMPQRAKPYLKKIIDKYGDTEYAAEAGKLLAKIEAKEK
jgi:hypothetical protein